MGEQLICPARNVDILCFFFQDLFVRYKLDCFYDKIRSSISNYEYYASYFFLYCTSQYISQFSWYGVVCCRMTIWDKYCRFISFIKSKCRVLQRLERSETSIYVCLLFEVRLSQMNDLWRTQFLMTEYWRAYKKGVLRPFRIFR